MVDDQTWDDNSTPITGDGDEGDGIPVNELDDPELFGDGAIDIEDSDNPENW